MWFEEFVVHDCHDVGGDGHGKAEEDGECGTAGEAECGGEPGGGDADDEGECGDAGEHDE